MIKNSSVRQFYESRYEEGYMSSWDGFITERVFNIIKDLNLPEKGRALDYGCGRGIFTNVIKKVLPQWDVSGCDISINAVESARKNTTDCDFFILDQQFNVEQKYDLIFTHHVLEHVEDIHEVFKFFKDNLQTDRSYMLHILPCGNPGSFEYRIAAGTVCGIQKDKGNRFFFEDEGHLRRLTTADMVEMSNAAGFVLSKEWYSNHFLGSIEWITDSGYGFIKNMFNPDRTIERKMSTRLLFFRWVFIIIDAMKFADRKTIQKLFSQFRFTPGYIAMVAFRIIFKPLAKLVSFILQSLAKIEWRVKKESPEGSEMFLFFEKRGLNE